MSNIKSYEVPDDFSSEAVVFQIEWIASGLGPSAVELTLPLNALEGPKLPFAIVAKCGGFETGFARKSAEGGSKFVGGGDNFEARAGEVILLKKMLTLYISENYNQLCFS